MQLERALDAAPPVDSLTAPRGPDDSRSHESTLADPSDADDRVEIDAVRQAVDELPARERSVVRLRFGFDGPEQSWREIAGALGYSEVTARTLLSGALVRLRAYVNGSPLPDHRCACGCGWAVLGENARGQIQRYARGHSPRRRRAA